MWISIVGLCVGVESEGTEKKGCGPGVAAGVAAGVADGLVGWSRVAAHFPARRALGVPRPRFRACSAGCRKHSCSRRRTSACPQARTRARAASSCTCRRRRPTRSSCRASMTRPPRARCTGPCARARTARCSRWCARTRSRSRPCCSSGCSTSRARRGGRRRVDERQPPVRARGTAPLPCPSSGT